MQIATVILRVLAIAACAVSMLAQENKTSQELTVPESLQLAYMKQLAVYSQLEGQLQALKTARIKALEEALPQEEEKLKAAFDAVQKSCGDKRMLDQEQLKRGTMTCVSRPEPPKQAIAPVAPPESTRGDRAQSREKK
ncbi:MAG TPA: hypothetical protein VKY31_15975 [Terriglobia bacterium]|nr:hypothetical protein [Terriglobia bacterium]